MSKQRALPRLPLPATHLVNRALFRASPNLPNCCRSYRFATGPVPARNPSSTDPALIRLPGKLAVCLIAGMQEALARIDKGFGKGLLFSTTYAFCVTERYVIPGRRCPSTPYLVPFGGLKG